MPEYEPLELIGTEGPTWKPLRGSPPSVLASQPAVQPPAITEDEVLVREDEMAEWLHYFCGNNDNGANLNGQRTVTSRNSPPHVPLGKAPESGFFPPEFELMELIWTNGPIGKPLRGSPPSVLEPQPSVQPLTVAEDEVLVREDEMTEWRHYFCGNNDNGANLDSQITAASANSSPHAPLGKVAESEFQVVSPVSPGKNAESDCHVAWSGTRTDAPNLRKVTAGTSGLAGAKRKGKEKCSSEGPSASEVSKIGSCDKSKDTFPKSLASRKLRASEVHNLSERRRRCRINEKMKALQELVPACNKLDKASMLDEAIAYMKFLQMQVKMMPMGCGMRQPMFPSVPVPYMQTMPPMGIGTGMYTDNTVPTIPYPHINQPIQVPTAQMQHQHDMEAVMFPYSHAGDPYHVPVIVPGQVEVSSQHRTVNKKMQKRKQAEIVGMDEKLSIVSTLRDISRPW